MVDSWDSSSSQFQSSPLYLYAGFQEGLLSPSNFDQAYFDMAVSPFVEALSISETHNRNAVQLPTAVLAPFQQQGEQTLGAQIGTNGTLGRLLAILSRFNRCCLEYIDDVDLVIDAHWQAHSVFPDSVGILKRLVEVAFAIGEEAENLPEGTQKNALSAIKHNVLVGCYPIANELAVRLSSIYSNKFNNVDGIREVYGSLQNYDTYLQRLQEKNTLPEIEGRHPNARVLSSAAGVLSTETITERIQQRLLSYEKIPQLLRTLEELNEKILGEGLSSAWPFSEKLYQR